MGKANNEKERALDAVSPQDAVEILKNLYVENKEMAVRIESAIQKYFRVVDIDEVAEDVYSALDFLDVEDLWDQSGPSREGYTEPGEMAVEMMEAALQPFVDVMQRYQNFGKLKEARLSCMGILKGIWRYERESQSEFKEWAGDGVSYCSDAVLAEWKKGPQNNDDLAVIQEFVKENCSA